jgi:trimeric autotransporter adhesin
MADEKVTQLPLAITSAGNDLYYLVQGGVSKAITFAELSAAINIGGGSFVASLNGLNGDILLEPGAGISIASAGTSIVISATGTTSITSLTGDVVATGPGAAVATVAFVGGESAASVASGASIAHTATSSNTASSVVFRDVSGNFAAGTITANLIGNASSSTVSVTSTNFTGSLSGDVTGTQSATSISSTVVTGKLLTGYTIGSNTPIFAADSILSAFGKVQAQINATSGGITALTGDGTATGPGSVIFTLNTVNSTPGSFGSATNSSIFTVNGKGLITAASSTPIQITEAQVTGLLSDLSTINSNITTAFVEISGKQPIGSYELTTNKGIANGYAPLDGSAKIPLSFLPTTFMEYQGSWNPSTNTPALSDGTGTNGYVYYVTAIFAGPIGGLTDPSMHNFQVGDLIIYSASVGKWQLNAPASGVSSVNGSQGAVTVNAINQLTGDVTTAVASGSQSEASTVVAIQGTGVSVTTPTDGQFLIYNSGPGKYVPQSVSGDATLNDTGVLTLATVNASIGVPGTFGSSSLIPVITVDVKGRITAISTAPASATAGSLTGTTLASNVVNSSLQNLGIQNATLNMGNNAIVNVSQIGIGTLTPAANTSIDMVNTSGATEAVQFTGYGNAVVYRGRYANGTLLSPTAAVLGNTLSNISRSRIWCNWICRCINWNRIDHCKRNV